MRKMAILAAAVTAALTLIQAPARAAHNTVTVATPQVRRLGSGNLLTGNVSVRNTGTNAQTGRLTFIIFEAMPTGEVLERNRKDLGTVDLAANGTTTVSYAIGIGLRGNFILLADYATTAVAHTHAGTLNLTIN